MKQMKPGQICTIDGERYRCRKNKNTDPITTCIQCRIDNNIKGCLLFNYCIKPSKAINTCMRRFGDDAYPIPIKSKVNDHEYVDLGLPSGTKWATCNIGASSPSDYGDYFAWGETTTKDTYTKKNSKTYEKDLSDISGNPQYDIAHANWGGSWRMPTREEWRELIINCMWTWKNINNHNGYKITGPSKKSIFLPAVGYRFESSIHYAELYGNYWSSSITKTHKNCSHALYFDSENKGINRVSCNAGIVIRPVLNLQSSKRK